MNLALKHATSEDKQVPLASCISPWHFGHEGTHGINGCELEGIAPFIWDPDGRNGPHLLHDNCRTEASAVNAMS